MTSHFTKVTRDKNIPCAIIHITTSGKNFSKINYSRRMYAILRRYTPEVVEGVMNECYADLTGLRTFFKMTYKQMVENILKDLTKEISVTFTIRVSTIKAYEEAKNGNGNKLTRASRNKNKESVSTYKEINKLFAGKTFVQPRDRKGMFTKRRKLTVTFLW